MPEITDSSVAEVSPNLYKAALNTNLSPSEVKQLQQMTAAQVKGKKLLKLSAEQGRKEFLQLDPSVQDMIRYVWSDKDMFKPQQNFLQRGLEAAGKTAISALNLLASPLTAGFNIADKSARTTATPYNIYAQMRQGVDFSKKLLSDAFDGKNSWNWEPVKVYEEKHGKAVITLARAIAENRTIGEAIDLYGKLDGDMLEAIKFHEDEPDKFRNIMQNLKDDAQVSPGRDVSNSIVKPNARVNQDYWAYKFNKMLGVDLAKPAQQRAIKKVISGPIDAIYRIATDPFTYVGVPTAGKASLRGIEGFKPDIVESFTKFGGLQTKGQRLQAQFQYVAERGGLDKGYAWLFKQPEVNKLWEEQLGPRIQKFAEAETRTEKANILRSFKFDFPEWYNTEVVRKFADSKVFNAKAAEEFFTKIDDMNLMFNGTVDGIIYRRNGIPFARRSRLITSAVHKAAYSIFNKSADVSTAETIAKAESKLSDALDVLVKIGNKDNAMLNDSITDIAKIQDDISTARKMAYKLGQSFERSPQAIFWGPDAVKNADSIRVTATMAGLDRDMAEAITLAIIDEPEDVQLQVVRNMQYAFLKRIGVSDDDAKTLLVKTYNETSGFYSVPNTTIPKGFEKSFHPASYDINNETGYLVARGGIHPSQLKKGIAPLPFDEIYQLATGFSKIANTNSRARNFMLAFGGATRNNFTRKWNDFWARYTLFPRLGIRTNVDESFMYSLTNEAGSVVNVARAKFDKAYKAATGITGSSSGIGMWKGGLYGVANKFGIKDRFGNPLDPRKVLPAEERERIVKELQKKLSEKYKNEVPLSEISHELIKESLASRMEEIYPAIKGKESWENMKRVMRHNPNFAQASINSIGAKNIISGKIDEEFFDSTFSVDAFTAFLKDKGLKKGRDYTDTYIKNLKESEIAITMWDNYNVRFGENEVKVVEGRYVSPVTAFFKNKGLRTPKDVVNARKDILEQFSVFMDDSGALYSENEKITRTAVSKWNMSIGLQEQGLSDAEIADVIVSTMLADMRYTFHGGDGYNQKLFDLVKSKHDAIVKDIIEKKKPSLGFEGAWKRASKNITWDEFLDATNGYRPKTDRINTRIVSNGEDVDFDNLKEGAGLLYQIEKFGNYAMEIMDRQVTGFFRNPVFGVALDREFKRIKPFEKSLADRLYRAELKNNPDVNKNILRARANLMAEKRATEIVVQQAQDSVLEYVDNPNIRSNFAVSFRHLGRFFRATEDFQRRMYRMYTKNPIRSLYRMRLLYLGLEANGSTYEDEKGDQFIIFPTDTIINSVIEPAFRILTLGVVNVQIPTYNDFTLKLRLINPSFSPDAGQPAFAGPLAAVPMLVAKAFLRDLPFVPETLKDKLYPYTNDAADLIDKYGLGHIGKNTDLDDVLKLMFPMLASTAIQTLSPTELNRQKSSAVIQAISYLEAYGNGLSVDATPKERYEYLKNLKTAVNNITAFQALFGQFSPGYPTLKETATLPDYLLNVGITSPKSEFWDIYNGILRNAGDDVTDPLSLAVATFIGKNPGKLAFLVPRNTKAMKVFLNKTDNLKNWSINNRKFVESYGEIAYIFAPKVGEYNPDIYSWLEAENLVGLPELEDYLISVQIEQDKKIYFAIEDQEKELLSKEADYYERKRIIADSTTKRQQLLWSNPLLEDNLNSGDNRGILREKLKSLNAAVQDKNSPIPSGIRAAMKVATTNVTTFLEYTRNAAAKNYPDYSMNKEAQKQELVALLKQLSEANPEVKEANRLIFTPLINQVARDTVSAGVGG